MIGDASERIQGAAMRRLLAVLGLIGVTSNAFAGDLPTLRGSEVFQPVPAACCQRWGGLYFGGQAGFGVASVDFSGATQDLVAHMLRVTQLQNEQTPSTWEALGKSDKTGSSLGGFIGFNNAWESLILGFELNYNRTNHSTSAPVFPITRVVGVGGNTDTVTITGAGSMNIIDVATVRARAGYEVGNFLPYFMIGVAAGRADVARSATAIVTEAPADPTIPPATFVFSEGNTKNGAFIFGWSLGGGIDAMILPNVFLRGEYEFVAFSPIFGIKASINTGRVGIGVKF
jgi:outer membrane immunogenic protein